MASVFEFLVQHEDAQYARQLCGEAFRQIDVLETELSRFNPSSDVSLIASLVPGEPAVLGWHAFECLKIAQLAAAETAGAFDVTVGPIFKCWRAGGQSRRPSPEELTAARARTGWQKLLLDEASHLAAVTVTGMQVDLGAIGKGYALDCAAEVFEEWGATRALLSAGGSTVLALDPPTNMTGWPVGAGWAEGGEKLALAQCALSGSGVAVQGEHIFDPRTGEPVRDRVRAWSRAPAAAWADALSTAFFVMEEAAVAEFCQQHAEVAGILLLERNGVRERKQFGWETQK